MPTSPRKDGRDRLTIHHVLTMTMGTDWDESSLPYSDPPNSEIAMDFAPDRYRYILERRVVEAPGKRWTYCGGATALLARIIAKGAGKPLHGSRAKPCSIRSGMGPTEWLAGRDGEPFAASGVRMSPRDLARIGLMMLRGRHGRRPCGRSRAMAKALHDPRSSASMKFAAMAISGSRPTSASASR